MKIMFMGTPEFACVSLERLIQEGYNVTSVVTTEDKPRGRGHKMTHPEVYLTAEKLGIKSIYQPVNLKKENFEVILKNEAPDLIAVVAYGKLLPEYVINYPKCGCINVHASLLPKYRGAAPMQWAIIDGEKEIGVTTMYMDTGLDTGDMLLKDSILLSEEDNFGTVHDKLAEKGASLLVKTIQNLSDIERIPQGESTTKYASMITKEMTVIDWSMSAFDINNLVRGLTPFPKASCKMNDRQIKILKTTSLDIVSKESWGTVVSVNKDSFDVVCGDGKLLRIYSIQPESKKPMDVAEYFKGNIIEKGTVLS